MALAVSAPAAETLFGPSDVAAIIGNGGLTVGINDYGRVSLCRWPSPSYSDQITYVTRDASLPALGIAPEHGCMWAIRLEDRTLWLTGAPWTRVPGGEHPEDPVLEIRTTTPGGEITAVQRVAVLPGADLLALHLSISGPATPPTVFWYQNITPCTRIIPEWPVADWAFDAANDFAAFVDDERIVHFRPESPTFVEWEEAERLNGRDSTPREWLAFDKGVYAVTASPQGFDTATCSQTGGGDAWHQVDAGALIGTRAAWGQCQSAAAVKTTESDGVFEATILIAFGPDYARATETLERYLDRPFEQLASETRQYWQDWLETMRLPASPDPHNRSLAQRALLTIGMCRDKTSGAIVRSPETQPPLCLDWPRNGVWISEAFTAAGRDDLARTLTSFHAKTQRLSGSEVRAYGSLPAACYANGVEGVPHVIRDLDATAWFLWETARRALGEERDVRESFWRELHPAITRAADFLIYWTDERTSKPLHAFSPGLMRDAQTLEQLVTTFLGINAAVAVAEGTGLPVPEEWRVRQGELRTLVEFACFNEEGDVRLDVPRAFMFAEVVRPGAPRMLPVFEALLKPGAQKDFPEGVATLLNGAYAAPGLATRPVLREAVEGFLAGMGQENGRIPKPLRVDALTSAEFYLLLMRTYGGEE
jgi:hypothetical protein